jgi:hypothetical protein
VLNEPIATNDVRSRSKFAGGVFDDLVVVSKCVYGHPVLLLLVICSSRREGKE